MAYHGPRCELQFAPPEPEVHAKAGLYYDDRESSVLDGSILDPEATHTPHDLQFRRPSWVASNTVLTPARSHTWDTAHPGFMTVETVFNPPGAEDYSDRHFAHHGAHAQAHAAPYGHAAPGQAWSHQQSQHQQHGSVPGMEYMPPHGRYDHHLDHHRQLSQAEADEMHAHHHQGLDAYGPQQPAPPGYGPAHQIQTPVSPQHPHDWMHKAEQDVEDVRARRARVSSPPRTAVDLQRRDRIRKKNQRIEIPQERSIHNIDNLILQSTDEVLTRELKQQKRLLRNREAA